LLPLSKSQIERLGGRLLDGLPEPDGADADLLRELLGAYRVVLDETVEIVSDRLGLQPTSRIKNRGTILEKLQRQGGSWLKSMYDVAGMRIVGSFDRSGQDVLVDRLVAQFSGDRLATPRVIDRRANPSHGYRAVHVIVFPHGVPVEIQMRTSLQHEWAEVFEKLADKVGRGIRYGEPPENAAPLEMQDAPPDLLRRFLDAQFGMYSSTVNLAMILADAIDTYESADRAALVRPRLHAFIEKELANLRASLDDL
jgi:ppGpp synthetase/RelA/SpoT-type nucleotidyltranferase